MSVRTDFFLIKTFIKRDISKKYRGTALGLFWAIFQPLMMLLLYTLVFTQIFPSRWRGDDLSGYGYSLIIFSGLIIHGIFAEVVTGSVEIIRANPNFVTKVKFPLYTLPIILFGTALFNASIQFGILFVFILLKGQVLSTFSLLLPFVLLPFFLFIMGTSWIFAVFGVYFKDVGQFISVVTSALLFLAPIFYPISQAPEGLKVLIYFNPLTVPVEAVQDLIFWKQNPFNFYFFVYSVFSISIFLIGLKLFSVSKGGFSDAL